MFLKGSAYWTLWILTRHSRCRFRYLQNHLDSYKTIWIFTKSSKYSQNPQNIYLLVTTKMHWTFRKHLRYLQRVLWIIRKLLNASKKNKRNKLKMIISRVEFFISHKSLSVPIWDWIFIVQELWVRIMPTKKGLL